MMKQCWMGGTKADRARRPSGDNVGMSALRWERIWAGTAPHRWKGQRHGGLWRGGGGNLL